MGALPPVTPSGGGPRAVIAVSPFTYAALDDDRSLVDTDQIRGVLRERTGRPFLLTESGRHALHRILAELELKADDCISIVTTSGGDYVSRCVTETIEQFCAWSMTMEPRTRAVLVIHEWGRACEQVDEALRTGLPVIEDCAYAFASRYANGERVGGRGHYALFSLPKLFSVNYGGIAVGLRGDSSTLPDGRADYVLRMIGPELLALDEVVERRRAVVDRLAQEFGRFGAAPFFEEAPGAVMPVYMFRHDDKGVPLSHVRKGYESVGVEASVFYGHNAFFVPAHHRLGEGQQDFLVDTYRSLLSGKAG